MWTDMEGTRFAHECRQHRRIRNNVHTGAASLPTVHRQNPRDANNQLENASACSRYVRARYVREGWKDLSAAGGTELASRPHHRTHEEVVFPGEDTNTLQPRNSGPQGRACIDCDTSKRTDGDGKKKADRIPA